MSGPIPLSQLRGGSDYSGMMIAALVVCCCLSSSGAAGFLFLGKGAKKGPVFVNGKRMRPKNVSTARARRARMNASRIRRGKSRFPRVKAMLARQQARHARNVARRRRRRGRRAANRAARKKAKKAREAAKKAKKAAARNTCKYRRAASKRGYFKINSSGKWRRCRPGR